MKLQQAILDPSADIYGKTARYASISCYAYEVAQIFGDTPRYDVRDCDECNFEYLLTLTDEQGTQTPARIYTLYGLPNGDYTPCMAIGATSKEAALALKEFVEERLDNESNYRKHDKALTYRWYITQKYKGVSVV